ncbi:MAG: Rrf2 family transcriptional regulator [Elusimicrobia bacterium]|nr:Rrf2 family transcriptional regulator [Elusimicrobiota bacterium]
MDSADGLLFSKAGEAGPEITLFHFSSSLRHALSAISWLVRQKSGAFFTIEDIAKAQGLPPSFLAKILRQLARWGITTAQRGPGDGHALGRNPEQISLAEVIRAVERPSAERRQCLFELHGCGGASPCAIHDQVCLAERQLWKVLGATTVASYTTTRFHESMK